MSRRREMFLHSIVWAAILLLFLFATSDNGAIRYTSIIIFVYFGIINISIFYINYLFIAPEFLLKKRYITFLFSIILLIVAYGFVKYSVASYFKDVVLYLGPKRAPAGSATPTSFAEYFFRSVSVSTFFIFLSTAFRFTVDWFINEKVRKSLENEKLAAELAFLKSQINPHFLLNSLNNIYSLAYQRSPKTPEAILKLSEIMRYMLYESNDQTKVDLSKEIGYLESYIDLQKLRFKNEASVKLEILEDGSYYSGDGTYYTIVPLILISFVENAFKHGVATDGSYPIDIKIHIKHSKLHFRVSNKKNVQNKDETGGIGLQNVKRRLDLLYPGKYTLEIQDSNTLYTSELSLDL